LAEQLQHRNGLPPNETGASQRPGLFAIVAIGFTLASSIGSVMSVHLLSILEACGLSLSAAVGLGTLVGPRQIAARLYEVVIGHRFHPTWTFLIACCLITAGLALLPLVRPAVVIGIVLYGGGAGMMTIARSTLPLALFGQSGYPTLIGRLAFPTFVAQAIAPPAAAVLLEGNGGAARILTVLISLAVSSLVLILMDRLS
jgi:hypothetical protein